jgi:two-component system chemotaxis response regulator CheB
MLSRSPFIEVVGVARDGKEALEMVEELKPDVVTCDLQMPLMDGVRFVREQMSRRPLPILILTASSVDAEGTLEAMEAGAVDFVQKPTALANEEILSIRDGLVEKVKEAAKATLHARPEPVALLPVSSKPRQTKIDLVVIGISTGGPQALRYLIPQFPADFPVPIAIVLHMPVGYTQPYAQKLGEISKIRVKEAREGEPFIAGQALIAQAGRHLLVRRTHNGHAIVQLSLQPIDLPHRPAADILFQSAAEVYGNRVLGVVMTGMGYDGREGAAWIKAKGGTILTEAEESCVIYGMPRSVVEAGLSDGAIPLNQMARAITERL